VTSRIGTWNLAGRWSDAHEHLLTDLDCDVLLLTEVRRDVELASYHRHLTEADMATRRAWAGIYSREHLEPCSDPHPASALAQIEGRSYCSSILPWKGSGGTHPWSGVNHAAKTQATVEALRPHLRADVIWGGDFNHAMTGREYAGSKAGRGHIEGLLGSLPLRVPTTHLAHRIPGLLSIDHIAVPAGSVVSNACRFDATGLSDHDAYVVTLD
jgi:endonuclease/exonuclease/phosphatase family metal-dependent hydrolase